MIPLLHFDGALARGGVEEHILTLLRGLDRKLFRLHLVCTPPVAERMRPDLPPDVELIPLLLRRPTQMRAACQLAKILRDRRIAILHSHMFFSSLCASPVGRLCRVPVIIETPHIRELWRHGWKSYYTVDRLAGRCVDRYIAVSEANARYLAEVKGLPRRKMVVIKPGAAIQRFDPERMPPPGLKQSLGFDDADPVLVVVGRLEPQKGHSVLLRAMPLVLREFPSARLVCVGEGALRSDLEQQARGLQLDRTVRFIGYPPDVLNWLALADFTVLPSFFEGLPLVAIESLAAGRPMVATAVDGTPEVILDGQTGLLVPPGDPERLAAAICRMLGDPALRRRLGRAGRALVEAQFSREKLVRETQDFYLKTWQAVRH